MRHFQRGFVQFIPAIAAGISALGGFFGSRKTNKANEAVASQQMAYNAEEADKSRVFSANQAATQMAFQERMFRDQQEWSEAMSGSSYQRAVGDLSKAGLNPMLAYSQGGAPQPQASAPSGAMGSSSAASYHSLPQKQNAIQVGIASAMQGLQLANLDKQNENIEADTLLKRAEANRANSGAGQLAASMEETLARIPKIKEEINLIGKQAHTEVSRKEVMDMEYYLNIARRQLADGQLDQVKADTALMRVNEILKKLEIPQAKAFAEKWGSGYGESVGPYMREAIDIIRTLIYGRK